GLQALVSCEVLTEGYDEPGVSCVVMARPTTSKALYQQCVGRGLRAASGRDKHDCLVLDVIDRGRKHDVVHAARQFGGPVRGCEGRAVREAVRREQEGWQLGPLSPTAAQLGRWENGEDTEWPELPSLDGYAPVHGGTWPASEKQLRRLKDYGMEANRPLTSGEA